jgi:hypothetical protein
MEVWTTLSYALVDYFRFHSSPEIVTCTDKLQQWNQPRARKVEPIPVEKIGERRRNLLPSKFRSKGSQMVYDPRPLDCRSKDEQSIENLCCELLLINKPCWLLNILIPDEKKMMLDHNYCSESKSPISWPELSFCDPSKIPNVFSTSIKTKEDVMKQLTLNENERLELEKKTRSQTDSEEWFIQRQYRITGSKCERIIKQKEVTKALLQSTIYPKPMLHFPKSIHWGRLNEDKACESYEKYMKAKGHDGLHTEKAGFIVDPCKCWFGASPDAWVFDPVDNTQGIAEFKCLYTFADVTPEEMLEDKNFYYSVVNSHPYLNRDHQYYHQVQLQLYVSRESVKWCDFCVYSQKGVLVERIYPNKEWQKTNCPKLDNFFFNHILPEMIEPKNKPSYY